MINKTYLISHIILLEEIGIQEEHLQEIEEEMTAIPARSNDGMPHGSRKENDRMAVLLERKEKIEKKVKELQLKEKQERYKIEKDMNSANLDTIEEQIIYLRYICGYDWSRVQKILFIKKNDYYAKEQSYKRRMFRIHKRALEKMDIK